MANTTECETPGRTIDEGRTPEILVDSACETGEGPMWHPDERCIYWVDIPRARLFRHTPLSGETITYDTGTPVGGFTIHEDGRLLLFMADGVVRLWDHGDFETVIDQLPEEHGNRFNDVIADPEGRVFCGVMSTAHRAGRLYRLDPDRAITVVLEDTGTANGMGFSPDLRKMYFCDSRKCEICVFDYDRGTGALSDQRVIARPTGPEGRPDGMTVDADGFLWSARWDGARVVRMDPDGNALEHIRFPVRKVSSVTFGGDNLTDMYFTTAGGNSRHEDGEHAGALFHMNLGIRGKKEFRSR